MQRSLRATVLVPLAAAALAVAAGPTGAAGAAGTDQQIAQQGVIVSTDVPATWTASPRDDSGDQQSLKVAKKIPTCTGYVAFQKANDGTTGVQSQDFSSGDDQIHNSSYAYATDAAASKTFDDLGAKATVAKCLTQVLQQGLATQLKGNKDVKKYVAKVKPVNQSTSSANIDGVGFGGGYQVTMKDGSKQAASIALVTFRVGRVINTYSATAAPDSTQISSVFQDAVAATVGRSVAAQA